MQTDADDSYCPQDERLLALQRLLESRTLSKSKSARRILKYIVEASVSGHAEEIKEYTIAVDALKCPEDFDPKTDNKIRVQVQRLRKKLEEYYRGEGAHDPIHILIPIGHYTPQFQPAPPKENVGKGIGKALLPSSTRILLRNNAASFLYGLKGLILVLLILVVALAMSFFRQPADRALSASARRVLPASLACLWQHFVSNSPPPLIIYSNAHFLISNEGDLYRFNTGGAHPAPLGSKVLSLTGLRRPAPLPKGIGPLYYFDAYTGTGEVVGSARIGQLLSREGEGFSIERDGVVSYSDIRDSNVIFLGASLEDPVLRSLPISPDLAFEERDQPEFVGSLEIRDNHPAPGQPSIYRLQRTPNGQAIVGDYALISLLPGMVPARYTMVLAGISTIGTEAAAEFATSKDSMRVVASMIPKSPNAAQGTPYFQALLHVQIRDGQCVKTTCLFVRKLSF